MRAALRGKLMRAALRVKPMRAALQVKPMRAAYRYSVKLHGARDLEGHRPLPFPARSPGCLFSRRGRQRDLGKRLGRGWPWAFRRQGMVSPD
jgi:hypothetical protein